MNFKHIYPKMKIEILKKFVQHNFNKGTISKEYFDYCMWKLNLITKPSSKEFITLCQRFLVDLCVTSTQATILILDNSYMKKIRRSKLNLFTVNLAIMAINHHCKNLVEQTISEYKTVK